MEYGLLGEKLGHSFSPQIHHALADYDYRLYPTPPEEVEDLDSRVDVLEAVTRRNVREIGRISRELEDLKRAQ